MNEFYGKKAKQFLNTLFEIMRKLTMCFPTRFDTKELYKHRRWLEARNLDLENIEIVLSV